MAHIGVCNGIDLIDTSSVLSANLEFHREHIAVEAQDLANPDLGKRRAVTV